MKKKIKQEQWVMLSTYESPISITNKGVIHYIGIMNNNYIQSNHHQPQHLYLTSDEKIEEGETVYDKYLNELVLVTSELFKIKHTKQYKKIIATTDKSLLAVGKCRECGAYPKDSKALLSWHDIRTDDHTKEFGTDLIKCFKCPECGHSWTGKEFIPQIPESFIKHYVAKQGKVGDVEVELKRLCRCEKINYDAEQCVRLCSGKCDDSGDYYRGLKLTDNNEIIVHLPEEEKMYPRVEMEKMYILGLFGRNLSFDDLMEKFKTVKEDIQKALDYLENIKKAQENEEGN